GALRTTSGATTCSRRLYPPAADFRRTRPMRGRASEHRRPPSSARRLSLFDAATTTLVRGLPPPLQAGGGRPRDEPIFAAGDGSFGLLWSGERELALGARRRHRGRSPARAEVCAGRER